MKRKFTIGGSILAAIIIVLALINVVRVQSYASSVASSDDRNEGVKVWAYYNHGLPGGSIVFDLRGISPENSQMDVFRVLLQFASAMKDRHFDRVYLAWKGERRFFLEGSYFNELGAEYEFQNPVYTLRTLPEHVRRPDGSQAYGTWTGGWLGVLGKQLEDVTQFQRDWYLDDAISR